MAKNEKIVQTVVRPGQQPTDEQIKEIEAAMYNKVVPDEDAPELTLEQYAEMAAIAGAGEAGRLSRLLLSVFRSAHWKKPKQLEKVIPVF